MQDEDKYYSRSAVIRRSSSKDSKLKPTKIAIVGLGTVGSGVAKILLEEADRITRHAGGPVELAHVVVRDKSKPLRIDVPQNVVTDSLDTVLQDDEVSIVAQLIGGTEKAKDYMIQLLQGGKDVVTANKALLAQHGPELFAIARETGRTIAFEAAVAGGIPIITNINQCLSANQITSLRGILNGTCNFIVWQMQEGGKSYGEALAAAQRLGYAEADPELDVNGADAAQKLAILAHLAFGANIDWSEIPREGVAALQSVDIQSAAELGFRVKLLAVAEADDEGLEVHVGPSLVKLGTPLAEVREAFNAIRVTGDAVGPVFYHGQGAGQMPTASAVTADLIDMVVGRAKLTSKTLDIWGSGKPRIAIKDPNKSRSRFYLRTVVHDRPGVLAELASILGRHDVSIASMIQQEGTELDASGESPPDVSLIIMTHEATSGAMELAIDEINKLDAVSAPSVVMRVA